MATKVEVTVCIHEDLGICTTKLLPLGSTVADLKEHLAADDPTGRTHSQDIALATECGGAGILGDAQPLVASLGKLVLVSAADKRELALPPDVVEYRVLQRVAIKKVGTDPATSGVVKLKRQVGSTVFTTGRTWVGPQGGEWVELDAIVEKPGWLLVQGPGFGIPGPLLQRVEPGEAPPLLLHAVKPAQDPDAEEAETREFVLGPQARVVDAKEWISLLFGLDPSSVIVAAPGAEKMHGTIEQCGVLKEGVGMVAAGFQSGDRVQYVYTGDLGSAYEGKEPAWKGRIGGSRPALPAALPAPDDLKKHFALLKLEVDAPHELIKGQYRRLALENHPDKHPDDPEATRRFQEIKEAYEALREKLHL